MNQAHQQLLHAEELGKSFGQTRVLKIDSLTLARGEAALLAGRNGSGKTTLLRILAGLERADRGRFRFDGRDLAPRNYPRAARGRVIYLHQTPYLFDRPVRDNIAYGLRCNGIRGSELERRVRQALAWSELEHLADRNARTLSGGERQRIALARAWVLHPELLLLDEPTANMDREACEQTFFLVRRLINEGMGVLMTSHGIREDHPLFSHCWQLRDGALSRVPANGDRTGTEAQAHRIMEYQTS